MPPKILKKVILSSLMKFYLYTINHLHLLKKLSGQNSINHGLLWDLDIPLEPKTNCISIT